MSDIFQELWSLLENSKFEHGQISNAGHFQDYTFILMCEFGKGRSLDKGVFQGKIISIGCTQEEGIIFYISLPYVGEDEVEKVTLRVLEDGEEEWMLHFRNSGTHLPPHKIPVNFEFSRKMET